MDITTKNGNKNDANANELRADVDIKRVTSRSLQLTYAYRRPTQRAPNATLSSPNRAAEEPYNRKRCRSLQYKTPLDSPVFPVELEPPIRDERRPQR